MGKKTEAAQVESPVPAVEVKAQPATEPMSLSNKICWVIVGIIALFFALDKVLPEAPEGPGQQSASSQRGAR
jgi:hypothetical protein